MPPRANLLPHLLYPRQANTTDASLQCQAQTGFPQCDCSKFCDGCTDCNNCCNNILQGNTPKPSIPAPTPTSISSSLVSTPTFDPSSFTPSFFSSAPTSVATSSASPVTTEEPSEAVAHSKNMAGVIAAAVVGGVILIALLIGGLVFWRKRRSQRRMAPSAEFMHHRSMQPSLSAPPLLRDGSNRDSSEDEDAQPPPPFSRGTYSDPIFEKLSAAAAQRQEIEQIQMFHSESYRDGYLTDEKNPADFLGESSSTPIRRDTDTTEDAQQYHTYPLTATESQEPLRRPSL